MTTVRPQIGHVVRRPRALRRLSSSLLLGLLLLVLAPAGALAHAQLEETVPQRGAVVRAAPSEVVFRFSEAVEGNFGAVRVFDAAGRRVDEGDAFHPGDRSDEIAVHLRDGLPDGSYTATYRVISADSHIISSGIVFSIGRAGAAGRTVGELLEGTETGTASQVAFGLARGLQFAALAVAVGALLFLLLVWRRALTAAATGADVADGWRAAGGAFVRRLRTVVVVAALVGAVASALGIVMQGAEGAGISGFDALRASIVKETLGTRFGTVWGIGLIAWLLLAALATVLLRADGRAERPAVVRPAAVVLAVPAVFLVLLPGLGGHAAAQSPVAVLLPANALHVLAMCVWVGGLAALLLVVPAATRRLPDSADRSRLLAATLLRFSPLALGAVAVILLSGILQSLLYLDRLGDLFDTGFGRAIVAKALLLLALIGLGAYQRRRSVPRLQTIAAEGGAPGRAGVVVRDVLRAEALLIVAVLVATTFLASLSPSGTTDAGPFSKTVAIGPVQLQLTVDPAGVGANAVHLYLIDPRDGSQFAQAREVTVSATEPEKGIGPIDQRFDLAGPGHFTASAMSFGVAGSWQVKVAVRISDFDQYETTVEVPIR